MKKLLTTGIVLSLIGANLVVCHQYLRDSKDYEKKINQQNKIIKQQEINKNIQVNYIRSKSWEIKVLREQLDKVKQEKQKQEQMASRGATDNHRKFYVQTTAYTSNCKGCSGFTYTEHNVRNTIEYNGLRIIAADTSIIPLYSIVRIDTKDKPIYAIVLDKGGAIKNYKVDLLVNTYNDAIKFGRQETLLTVLREGKG